MNSLRMPSFSPLPFIATFCLQDCPGSSTLRTPLASLALPLGLFCISRVGVSEACEEKVERLGSPVQKALLLANK